MSRSHLTANGWLADDGKVRVHRTAQQWFLTASEGSCLLVNLRMSEAHLADLRDQIDTALATVKDPTS